MSDLVEPERRTLAVHRWTDPLVDTHPRSMPVRSDEAELYWLPLIGPTQLLCARRLVMWLDRDSSIIVGLGPLTAMLGLHDRCGRNAPLPKAFNRLVRFKLAKWLPSTTGGAFDLALRCTWAPLSERQIDRLPELLAATYRAALVPA